MENGFDTDIIQDYSDLHEEFEEVHENLATYVHKNAYFSCRDIERDLESPEDHNIEELMEFLSDLDIVRDVGSYHKEQVKEYNGVCAASKIRKLKEYLEEERSF